MSNSKEDLPPSLPQRREPATAAIPVHEVRDLVGAGREARIRHNGEEYRLRITAGGKLILTK